MESNSLKTLSCNWTWKEVLDRLLNIIVEPVLQGLSGNKANPLPDLTRHCCHLVARVVAELVHQCSSAEVRNSLIDFVMVCK